MKAVKKEMIFMIVTVIALVMGAMFFFATTIKVSAATYPTLPPPAAQAFATHVPVPYPGPQNP
jgi:hypothetical protein